MGKFIYSAMVSLDGYIEDRDGSISWSAPDEEVHRYANDRTAEAGLVIMGRKLCESMEPYWSDLAKTPTGTDFVDEFARIWVTKPKLVFSRTLDEAPADAGLVRELDPVWAAGLRDKVDGAISLGGAALASDFAAAGLVDEVELITVPAFTGGGKPMFGPGFDGLGFDLIESRTFGSTTVTRYAVTRS
ncbi:MAG: dihydrofolate reductase family protein [Actinomycetota bacterium]|nr:dihydrofolate reductase family protein [Actinomycetota bacterium]